MKILLLGARGQLGHELLPLLRARGTVTAPGRDELDVSDLAAVGALLASVGPELVVNAAAYNEVDRAESEPQAALRVNAELPALLGAHAKDHGGALVHYSTDFVFDGRKGAPYVETDEPSPLSAYGRSKLAGEQALESARAPAIVLRTAWVYSLRRKSFVSQILKLAREREELRVVVDQVGSPTWCRDLARVSAGVVDALAPALGERAHDARGVYHAAGEGQCSRYELACAAVELDPGRSEHRVKRIEKTTADAFPAPAARPAFAPLDCSRLRERFGVRFLPWREALAEALASGP